VITGVEDKKT